jgi:hypothetical protein
MENGRNLGKRMYSFLKEEFKLILSREGIMKLSPSCSKEKGLTNRFKRNVPFVSPSCPEGLIL